jgi:tRNA A37 threonylcarbamoyladenosine biosynthesis protein TsaE
VRALGWDELLSHPENLVLVEWPGNIADAMPAETIPLSFEWVNDTTRAVTFP